MMSDDLKMNAPITALTLCPIRHVNGTIKLPGSKSLTNRVLLLAALAKGNVKLRKLLLSDDTEHMIQALKQLGCSLKQLGTDCHVEGLNGVLQPAQPSENKITDIFLGNAGTAMRPLTAALTLGHQTGKIRLHGEPRMHERPIGDLVDALRQLGASIEYTEQDGCPPVLIRPTGLSGGKVSMRGDRSSQFLTALLMVAPLAQKPVTIAIEGELVSKPYIDITLALMTRFGINVEYSSDYRLFKVPIGNYCAPDNLTIEGDASSASYFLAAGAIKGKVRVQGVGKPSLQGDVGFTDVLSAMGAKVTFGTDWIEAANQGILQGVDMDLNHIPDAAMTLATMALFAQGQTRIRNIANWRIKETNRLAAMSAELRKVGAKVSTTDDSLTITPPARIKPAVIKTYDDHRMAMCFSLAALGDAEITIKNPGCVSKTFPDYFQALKALCEH